MNDHYDGMTVLHTGQNLSRLFFLIVMLFFPVVWKQAGQYSLVSGGNLKHPHCTLGGTP